MEMNRIKGFDYARAFAILGMMLVNYSIVFNQNIVKYEILSRFIAAFQGRAAAVFVILAGIGIGLMTHSSYVSKDRLERNKQRLTLLKRAIFLFIFGLLLYLIFDWTADILHYYGVYMAAIVFFIFMRTKTLVILATVTTTIGSILQLFFDYSQGWNSAFDHYSGFFTVHGFLRNTFFNGYHPFFPWFAFLLFGLALSRLNFRDQKKMKQVTLVALIIAIVIELISLGLIKYFGDTEMAIYIFDTKPMNPTALYIFASTAWAIFFIGLCVCIDQRETHSKGYLLIANGGKMALTHYLIHVLVIVLMQMIDQLAYHDEIFVIGISLVTFVCMLLFSQIWHRKFDRGPIELLMRKVTK